MTAADAPPRAAVVGAGPAGFYAADQLLGAGFGVDVLEALPTPFGLVRFGVAPDHPRIKSVTRVYERTATRPGFRFFGCVAVGSAVGRDELLERYRAVVYAVGTPRDVRLGISGEDRRGSHSATDFVAWYNGHPDHAGHTFDLGVERAVVVGNGNVAIDVARMLVSDPAELARTDVAPHALAAFAASRVREVVVLGRRGPAQAAFTTAELRELGELEGVDVVIDPAEVADAALGVSLGELARADAAAARNVEVLRELAARAATGAPRRIVLRFLRSPVAIVGDERGAVDGLRMTCNRLEREGAVARAVPTDAEELLSCGLVLRSIGYRGAPLPGVPFEERRGLIRNEGGRVVADDGRVLPGEYVVGWAKRGPSGVIGTNKKDAADTVARVVEDAAAGRLPVPVLDGDAEPWLRARVPNLVAWHGWRAIDAHELRLGERQDRPRVKLVTIPDLLTAAATRV